MLHQSSEVTRKDTGVGPCRRMMWTSLSRLGGACQQTVSAEHYRVAGMVMPFHALYYKHTDADGLCRLDQNGVRGMQPRPGNNGSDESTARTRTSIPDRITDCCTAGVVNAGDCGQTGSQLSVRFHSSRLCTYTTYAILARYAEVTNLRHTTQNFAS